MTEAIAAARRCFRRCRINLVGVKTELVENFALLLVRQNIVGLGNLLELLFGLLVARIYVRVILARELAKRLADIVRRGGFFDTERAVIVLLWRSRHSVLFCNLDDTDTLKLRGQMVNAFVPLEIGNTVTQAFAVAGSWDTNREFVLP